MAGGKEIGPPERGSGAKETFLGGNILVQPHLECRAPVMALGMADQIWTIGELVEVATNLETVSPRHTPFTVIDEGLSQ